MTDVSFRNGMEVEVIDQSGDDSLIARSARVSTGKDSSNVNSVKDAGLIKYLLTNRHGSPFEHGHITFRVSTPLFVWREHMRHRIGISYNEESGRYRQLDPVFYIPELPRVQEGKPGHYVITDSVDVDLKKFMQEVMALSCKSAYASYQNMLDRGIAREVARMVLPLTIYSSAYVTMNPRSLMNFCSLRLPSNAQLEIRQVAQQYLSTLERFWPETAKAYREAEYEAP